MKELTQFELGYVAGIVDGEGCISIMRRVARRSYGTYHDFTVHVTVGTTTFELCERLMQWVGGKTYYPHEIRGNRKPQAYWVITRRGEVRDFLLALQPYLLIKKEQAKLALEFCQLGRSICPDMRANLHGKMMELNHRGVANETAISQAPVLTLQ